MLFNIDKYGLLGYDWISTIWKKELKFINWSKPQVGWVKLNVDGASSNGLGQAGAGGLIRDEGGYWMNGFGVSLGTTNNMVVELWAIIYGLSMARDICCRNMIIESD